MRNVGLSTKQENCGPLFFVGFRSWKWHIVGRPSKEG
jgi:hypothetical protein